MQDLSINGETVSPRALSLSPWAKNSSTSFVLHFRYMSNGRPQLLMSAILMHIDSANLWSSFRLCSV